MIQYDTVSKNVDGGPFYVTISCSEHRECVKNDANLLLYNKKYGWGVLERTLGLYFCIPLLISFQIQALVCTQYEHEIIPLSIKIHFVKKVFL